MNKQEFFKHYPEIDINSNKYDNGVILLISGSYGMAGAAILNIIGARSVGTTYIHSLLPESIYQIVSSREITTVYHPDNLNDTDFIKTINLKNINAIAIGSGLNNHPLTYDYLKYILENTDVPVIIDAYGLDLLKQDKTLFKLNNNIIITPHLYEFSRLTDLTIDQINNDRQEIARQYAVDNNLTLILKGKDTLVVSRNGQIYINETGNQALARAGSGDILTGMIAGLCAKYSDAYQACIDAIWLHGHLCDKAMKKHSKEIFDLTKYPEYADEFFFEK